MKHKVCDLTGEQLDAAVALAMGAELAKGLRTPTAHWRFPDGSVIPVADFTPSTWWAVGGPLIDAEEITVSSCGTYWQAAVRGYISRDGLEWGPNGAHEYGPTALVAAARAKVASVYGEEIDL